MSLAFTINLPYGLLAVEPIAELELLEAQATAAELESAEGITAMSRRAERLAWRGLFRKVAGEECRVSYSKQGAPCIENSQYKYISVSHCADCVALLLSDKPCGVDVERVERNFERVARKYISDAEREGLPVDSPLKMAAVWCAKEALYKMIGREGVDFLKDIEIIKLDVEAGEIEARLLDEQLVQLRIVQPDEAHILVFG